jgi:hypothetical protein
MLGLPPRHAALLVFLGRGRGGHPEIVRTRLLGPRGGALSCHQPRPAHSPLTRRVWFRTWVTDPNLQVGISVFVWYMYVSWLQSRCAHATSTARGRTSPRRTRPEGKKKARALLSSCQWLMLLHVRPGLLALRWMSWPECDPNGCN